MINAIWQEFLKIMQQEVGSQMVETWLKAVSLHQWDSAMGRVFLSTPNDFVREWLTAHYTGLFEQHLKRLFNVERVTVVFLDHKQSMPVAPASVQRTEPNAQPITYKPACVVSETGVARIGSKPIGSINSSYKFDTFVVGPSNQLAYAAAYAVTERPGKIYNPLFMYGGSGLGKTHLLHAIGNELKNKNRRASVLYQTADRFVNEFINAIRFDKTHQFQAKYKDIDALLIDDVQFISNKEQTQEAFFHIFNSLFDAHKQIVFSSDTYPHNINGIAERLRSRLESGLVADIQVPSLETKVAILKRKAEQHGVPLSDEIALFLGARSVPNIRALEGSLIQVIAVASLTSQPVTLELAKRVVTRAATKEQGAQSMLDFEQIVRPISVSYSLSIADLRSQSKMKEVVLARQIAMYLMKKLTRKSLHEIALFLGRKDHSTVLHAVTKIEQMVATAPDFAAQITRLEEQIGV